MQSCEGLMIELARDYTHSKPGREAPACIDISALTISSP
ncbi:hypothetical protein CSIRO_3045 [Bradyrhizobiaceae bacterium SG-6C]|nr:hypothetical protein CSIRO_3045 [Bradyrhizobiaceae bacterium SG-6C]